MGVDASRHVSGPDFSAVIDKALEMPGFTAFDAAVPPRTHTVGYGHATILSVADQILGAVQGGQLSHIFVVGGCDGNEPQRKYYQRLHAETPSDAIVITLGCGKFRILGQVRARHASAPCVCCHALVLWSLAASDCVACPCG